MAQEITKVIKIESPNGERTIAGLRKEIGGLRDQLLNLDKDSKEYEQTLQKLTKDEEELARATQIGKVAFSETKNELKQLKQQLDQLEPGTQQYIATFKRAADLTHTLSERQQVLKNSSNDLGTQLNNVRGIAQGMIGGMNALSAAMGLLGKDSDDVQKAMLRLQQGMAIVQGLQGMEGMINKLKGMTMAMRSATVTTKGLTGGIRALNAAIKANPVGLLITALSALIIYGKDLFNWIVKLIGGQEQLNAIWDKTKAIAVGLGNAIWNYLITPVRTAIHYFATLGTIMKDVFTGNWSKIRTDFKDGVDKIKDDFVKGFSFMKNYKEGYDEQMIRNTKKRNAQLIKEQENLNKNYITKYEKDLDNYIKDQEAKLGADWKWTAEGKKYYENLFQTRMSMYKKDTDEYRKAQRDAWSYAREYQERIDKMKDGSGTGRAGGSKKDAEAERIKALVDGYKEVKDYIDDIDWSTKKIQDREIEYLYKVIDYMKEMDDGTNSEELFAEYEKIKAQLRAKSSEEIAKPYVDAVYKIIDAMETNGEAAVKNMESMFDFERITVGVQIPADLINNLTDIYEKNSEIIKNELDEVTTMIEKMKTTAAEGSDTFQSLVDKRTELEARQVQLQIQYIKDISDAEKQGYEARLAEAEKFYERIAKRIQTQQGDPSQNVYGLPQQRELDRSNDLYNVEKERLTKLKDLYEEMSNDMNLVFEERQNAQVQYINAVMDLEDLELEHQIKNAQIEKELLEQRRENYLNLAESLSSVLGSVADAWQSEIQAQVDAGKMSEEEGKKQFEYVKGLQIAEAVINTISGAIAAFTSAQSLGFPWGQIIGAANAAAVTAAGVAQIAKIKNTEFGGKGTSSVADIAAPAVAYNPTADFNDQLSGIGTGQSELSVLSNAVTNGFEKANLSVSVSEIDSVQSRVKTRENEATW